MVKVVDSPCVCACLLTTTPTVGVALYPMEQLPKHCDVSLHAGIFYMLEQRLVLLLKNRAVVENVSIEVSDAGEQSLAAPRAQIAGGLVGPVMEKHAPRA
eukprot:1394901-Amorphochlora_amoeboformis.AAC.1